MNITSVSAGDIVECDVRGIKFYATVEETAKGELKVQPHSKQINYFRVRSNQVIGHFKKMQRNR